MADEKKTYLVNVESNLDQYAKDAAEAKKRVDELTVANIKLQASDTATAAEKEAGLAALKNANDEYRKAAGLVKTQIAANSSESGSRKQLSETLKLQMEALGKLGNAYITNAKGQRELNPLYIEQRNKIKATSDAIKEYDKSLGDGRSSVGLYSEAIKSAMGGMQMMPGVMGQAASGVQRLSMAFKALIANPVVLAITAIIAVIGGLLNAWKSSDKGGTEFIARFEQIKAIIDVVRQRLIAVAEAIRHVFRGEWKEAGQSMKEAFTGIGEQIREATSAAYQYRQELDRLENSENNYISRSAELKNAIAKLEFTAQDRSKSTDERKKALEEALKLGEQEVLAQRDFAKQRLETEARYLAGKNNLRMEDIIAFTRMTDVEQANASESLKTLRNNNEEKLIEIEKLYAAWINADTKFYEENKRNIGRLTGFIDTIAKDFQKLKDENIKAIEPLTDMVNAEIRRFTKVKEIKTDELRFNKDIADQNERLTEQSIKASDWETEQYIANQGLKLQVAADSLASLANIIGEQTEVGKGFAIAAATIDTFAAAGKTLNDPTIPSTLLRIAMMTAVILRGLANVKQIAGVNVRGAKTSASVPTSIVTSAPAQRTFATPLGSTIFNQPQLSQSQLNTLPSQNLLTASDIANALKNMPPPIVTVEDINAKVKAVNKVTVRGNI